MRAMIPLLLLVLLLASGCRQEAYAPADLPHVDEEERMAAIGLLERAGLDSLEAAFARVDHRAHVLHERLHQLDGAGRVTAYRRRALLFDPPEVRTLHAEAGGTFDFGAFGRFVSFDDLDRLPRNPVPFLLAEEAPFLTPRGREAYHFAFEPDTSMAGAAVRVVLVRAHPVDGNDQPLRLARLLIDAESEQIVALRVHRASSHLLFGETSVLEVALTRAGGAWLPDRTHYMVALRAPLAATRRFQLERHYELPREAEILATDGRARL